jgi:hypothetical protein
MGPVKEPVVHGFCEVRELLNDSGEIVDVTMGRNQDARMLG